MKPIPTVDSAAALLDEIRVDEHTHDGVTQDMCDRIVELATQRTQMRGEGPLEQSKDYLLTSDWKNMTTEKLGWDGRDANAFALGEIDFEVSEQQNAYLVKSALVLPWSWLRDEDGYTEPTEVDLTSGQYHDDIGEMWWPKDYALVVEFADSLVKEPVGAADVM